jgi:SAM-dependent methyltransferase
MTEPITWRPEDTERWLSVADQRESMLQPVLERLLDAAALLPGEHVLDVGCGTGPTTRAAALAVRPGGTVTGLDLAPELVAEAARRVQEPEVRWLAGDATVVDLPDAHYDAVISRFGVMFFADPVAAFSHLAAATRPGGRLAMAVWPARDEVEQFALPYAAALRALTAAGIEPDEPDPHRGPSSLGGHDDVLTLLANAGWSDAEIRVEEPRLPAATPGADLADVARGMLQVGGAGVLMEEAPDEVVAAAAQDLATRLAERADDDGVHLGGRVHLLLAVRR